MNITEQSLEILREISSKMEGNTFHHHFHFLYDIPIRENGYYVEIGCYAGASSCLMLQKEKINVVSIDLGFPVDQSIAEDNIKKFNAKENFFRYIKGNSHAEDTIEKLKTITKEIDILFVDGDHTKESVMKDFFIYSDLVISGGYIVFDDYNDHEYSPEVKLAVDSIVEKTSHNYEIIGTIENTFGARPRNLPGNCFVMRKL